MKVDKTIKTYNDGRDDEEKDGGSEDLVVLSINGVVILLPAALGLGSQQSPIPNLTYLRGASKSLFNAFNSPPLAY